MTLFWIVAGLLVLTALAFIVLPLWRRRSVQTVDRTQVNLSVYRDQLDELEADFRNGTIAEDQYEQGKQELERRLLDDVNVQQAPPAAETAAGGASKVTMGFVAVIVPVLAIGLYLHLGQPEALNPEALVAQPEEGMGPGHSVTPQMIEGMVEKLVAKLEKEPNDPEGWRILGKSMFVLERFPEAAFAFQQAAQLTPNDADVFADLGDALAMANGGSLEGKPMEAIQRALELNPNHEKALWIAGTAAYNDGNFQEALRIWKHLLETLPPGSPDAQSLQGSIAEAEAQLTGKPAADSPQPVAAAGGGKITGVVKLGPQLAGKIEPGDTVFVFARAVDGPRMPLAIVRASAGDLPMQFTLDDSMSMMPGMSLSGFSEVVVGARISKTGNAMPQSGDLEGLRSPVKVGTENVEIVIDKVVP